MYTIKQNLVPLRKEYSKWLDGYYLSGLLQFKSQRQIGGEYVSKVFKAQAYKYKQRYQHIVMSVQSPTYFAFLKDNLFRLLCLNGIERLVSACQVVNTLVRPGRPSTMSFLFTEIMNDGAFRGTLRGLSMNFLQTSLILWPAVAITNKTQGGLFDFVLTFTLLDAILHPLDTIKNRMYASTQYPLRLKDAIASTGVATSYAGLLPKLAFNIPYTTALYTTATDSDLSIPLWIVTMIAYPLHSLKSICQVSSSISNVKSLYRGVIPFMLVNYFFTWKLLALYPRSEFPKLRKQIAQQSIDKIGYY